MPCGWEGNRRSGVALAMRLILQWINHGPRKRDEHPAYTLLMGMALFTLRGQMPLIVMSGIQYEMLL